MGNAWTCGLIRAYDKTSSPDAAGVVETILQFLGKSTNQRHGLPIDS